MSKEIRLKVTEYFKSLDTLYYPFYGSIQCDTKILDRYGMIEFATHPLADFKYVCPLAIAVCNVDTLDNNYSTLSDFTHKGLLRFHQSNFSPVKPPYGIIASSEEPSAWLFYEHRSGNLEPIAKSDFECKVIERGNKSIRWAKNKLPVWRSEWEEVSSLENNRIVAVLIVALSVVILILLAILFPDW